MLSAEIQDKGTLSEHKNYYNMQQVVMTDNNLSIECYHNNGTGVHLQLFTK